MGWIEGGGYRPQRYEAAFTGGGTGGGERREGKNRTWQEIARTHRIESKAQNLGIPERSWNHPTVHSFVEATLDVGDLQTALSAADTKHSFAGQYNYAKHGGKPGEVTPGAPGMRPSLADRYIGGELLMRGVHSILEDGLGGEAANFADYLAGKIGVVTGRFGIRVTRGAEGQAKIPADRQVRVQPGSAWADYRPVPHANLYRRYASAYGAENFKLWWNDAPGQNSTREDEDRISQTAQRLGIPEQNIPHPTVHEFITNLHAMEDVLKTFKQGEVPPGAPGLTPSVAERYTMGAHLTHVALAIMQEGFDGRVVKPQFVAQHVNSALARYGLQARVPIE